LFSFATSCAVQTTRTLCATDGAGQPFFMGNSTIDITVQR
jgi:hypothetical protein